MLGHGRGGGDAVARSVALLQGPETGTTRIAGHLPDLEGRRDHRPLPRTGSGEPGCGGGRRQLTPEVVNGFVNETGRNCRDDVRRTVMAGTGG
jgi:hypothetical protein